MKIFLQKIALITCALLFSAILTVACHRVDGPTSFKNFTLPSVDGKEYSLSQYKGKIIVLEWTSLDCPCAGKQYTSNNMQKLQEKYRKQDVVWFTICSSAPGNPGYLSIAETQKRLLSLEAKPTAYLIDESGTVGHLYGAKTTPHMFVLNQEGLVVYNGAIDNVKNLADEDVTKADNYVAQALDALLAGQPIVVKRTISYGCAVKYKHSNLPNSTKGMH